MQFIKKFFRLFICTCCILFAHNTWAAGNIPFGNVGEYGNWVNGDNFEILNNNLSNDFEAFQNQFQNNLDSSNFVPIEAKIGLVFMQALSSIDYVLQISLVRFAIMFLFAMYAFWIGIEAYKMIRETSDYKTVLYDIFKKGFIIAAWIIVLQIGVADIFDAIISPVLAFGTYLSDFILNAVAQTYDVQVPNTCAAIKNYVAENNSGQLLIDSNTAANIMCLPARLSVYFYHATGAAWQWMKNGFGTSTAAVVMGAVCIVIFIKCIFKYAFMTLGIVADLFLKLLMLPFTAIAESMPTTSEKNYIGQIFNGLLKLFNAQKLSGLIAAFVNAAIYFVSLSILISICAVLLKSIVYENAPYETGLSMTYILCGCLVLYMIDKIDTWTKKLGGEINNSFGEDLQKSTEKMWKDTRDFVHKVYQEKIKK